MREHSWDKDRQDTRSRGAKRLGRTRRRKKKEKCTREGRDEEKRVRGHGYIHARGYCAAPSLCCAEYVCSLTRSGHIDAILVGSSVSTAAAELTQHGNHTICTQISTTTHLTVVSAIPNPRECASTC